MQSIIARRQAKIRKVPEPKQEDDDDGSWFDFNPFDFKYSP